MQSFSTFVFCLIALISAISAAKFQIIADAPDSVPGVVLTAGFCSRSASGVIVFALNNATDGKVLSTYNVTLDNPVLNSVSSTMDYVNKVYYTSIITNEDTMILGFSYSGYVLKLVESVKLSETRVHKCFILLFSVLIRVYA